MLIADGVWLGRLWVAKGPVYFSPSSPGAKVTDEQNPSEDVMSNVDPSFDLFEISDWICNDSKSSLPCNVRKCGEVQIADYAQWLLLLGIVYVNSVLCRYRIYHAIRKAEGGDWTCRRCLRGCIAVSRLRRRCCNAW